ncbi:MAG: glycosyltransferase [Rickettsiales bacterium]|nr:glycosyltransferase [Rickettsiales bacterium]
MVSLSIIIPLAPNETQHEALLDSLPKDGEVILSQEGTRAKSLNVAAAKATGEYLWFLHADSQLPDDALAKLNQAIKMYPKHLLYFDLAFADGSLLMKLNAWGANLRSRLFSNPFGDQGLCIKRSLFEELGGYPENVEYGEDNLFVIRTHKAGVGVSPVGATLKTSARKYVKNGWLRTTMMHQYLGWKQRLSA